MRDVEEVVKLSRTKVLSKLKKNKGLFFSCIFTKKNGKDRLMHCRLGVKKGQNGGQNKVQKPSNGLLTIWDKRKEKFRTLNLDTVKELKVRGTRYEVV